MSTKLKKAEQGSVALPDWMAQDAGAGFEEADKEAYAIPFLTILQSGSPQCKKSDGAYIKGAEEGMIFDTVAQEIIDGDVGIVVIPVHYQRRIVEWAPRESGGGFVAEHLPEQAPRGHRDESGRDVLDNGNYLVDTRYHYVLYRRADDEAGDWKPALITMSSTQLKKSRRWMTLMQSRRVAGKPIPMFGATYHLTTVPESNDKGSWFGWAIAPGDLVMDADLYAQAKGFRESLLAGEAKVQHPEPQHADDYDEDVGF